MENLAEAITNLHWSETGAVIFGIIYVVLAAKENVWCWFFGIVSCSLWAWATYEIYDLYIDALLQVFYVIVSFLGIYQWLQGSQNKRELKISTLPLKHHVSIICVGIVISLLVGCFFSKYTAAASTYLDSITTVFSIFATFMVVKKILGNWIYWIVVDSIYIYLYWSRGSLLFTLLMVAYTIIAILGYLEWRKKVQVS